MLWYHVIFEEFEFEFRINQVAQSNGGFFINARHEIKTDRFLKPLFRWI